MLLFDRLCEAGGPDRSGRPAPNGSELVLDSLRRELSRLLNTRLPPGLAAEEAATVTGYGVPDWSLVSPASAPELQALAETIAGQVRRFEPRLHQVRVQLVPDARRRNAATGTLEAVLFWDRLFGDRVFGEGVFGDGVFGEGPVLGGLGEPVCFRLAIEAQAVTIETETT